MSPLKINRGGKETVYDDETEFSITGWADKLGIGTNPIIRAAGRTGITLEHQASVFSATGRRTIRVGDFDRLTGGLQQAPPRRDGHIFFPWIKEFEGRPVDTKSGRFSFQNPRGDIFTFTRNK